MSGFAPPEVSSTAVADSTGGLCAYLKLPDGASTTTIESKSNFFRAVGDAYVDAISRPLQRGRRIIVIETDLVDGDARLVDRVLQSQLVLPPSVIGTIVAKVPLPCVVPR